MSKLLFIAFLALDINSELSILLLITLISCLSTNLKLSKSNTVLLFSSSLPHIFKDCIAPLFDKLSFFNLFIKGVDILSYYSIPLKKKCLIN